ncbi:Rv3235 family protein [Streptomyces antibioticus]|uniref:Rv3235 family protein n=1 Tax=Streptomyces antibioticus TaxID=1890 RepID=UPI0036D9179A
MNKVMTRDRRTPGSRPPGSRPPGRRDTRRPTGAPPRGPGGGTLRTAPSGPRPPAAPRTVSTRPADNRPAAVPPRPPRPTDLFADRLVAVLSGQRPVHSMLRHTVGSAYDDLAHLAESGPLRPAHGVRPVVRDIGYYVARPGAVEAFARIGAGNRLRAMAFRLERGPDHRWRCTAIELDGPRASRPRTD